MLRAEDPYTAVLPLEPDPVNEGTLRAAHARCRLHVPFEAAMNDPALGVCLRNLAEAYRRRRKRQPADH